MNWRRASVAQLGSSSSTSAAYRRVPSLFLLHGRLHDLAIAPQAVRCKFKRVTILPHCCQDDRMIAPQ
eukprot:1012377-Amphidinium_carterae.1